MADRPDCCRRWPTGPAAADGGRTAGRAAETAERKPDPRAARKELARLERQLAKFEQREAELHAALAEHATDYVRIAELNAELQRLVAERDETESRWLELSDQL